MDEYFFNNILILTRRRMKLSQKEFARQLGVAHQTISSIENKRITPSVHLICKFCNAFDFKIDITSSR